MQRYAQLFAGGSTAIAVYLFAGPTELTALAVGLVALWWLGGLLLASQVLTGRY